MLTFANLLELNFGKGSAHRTQHEARASHEASAVPAKFTQVQKYKWPEQCQQSLRKCRGTQVEMARAEPAKVSQVQEYTDHTAVVKG